MLDIVERIESVNWQNVSDDLNRRGYAVLPGFLMAKECLDLIGLFDHDIGYRKTVVMERYRFGLGLYKYWDYPLPHLVHKLREQLYPRLAPIANSWMNACFG